MAGVMIEAGRRAHAAYLSRARTQRAQNWNVPHFPDEYEGFVAERFTQENENWFKTKSHLTFEHPSVVLVEKAIDKNELLMAKNTGVDKDAAGPLPAPFVPRPMQKTTCIIRRMELTNEGFLEFLFSDRWPDGCLLRVLTGRLLHNVLHALVQLERFHDVVNYTTMAYIQYPIPIVPCQKGVRLVNRKRRGTYVRKVMVELDIYCPQGGITSSELEVNALLSQQTLAGSPQQSGTAFAKPAESDAVMHSSEYLDSSLTLAGKHSSKQVSADDVDVKEDKSAMQDQVVARKCNMRGELEPPPHTNCLQLNYHMVREPFFKRRLRMQSGLPVHQAVPFVPFKDSGEYKRSWADRWQDDYFLGPKDEEGASELVGESVVLDRYVTDETERPGFTKNGAAFSSQRKALDAVEINKEKKYEAKLEKERKDKEKREKEREKEREKLEKKMASEKGKNKNANKAPDKPGKKGKVKKDSDEDDASDEGDYEVETVCRPVSPSRTEKLRKELDVLKTDMQFCISRPSQKNLVSAETKLQLAAMKRMKVREYQRQLMLRAARATQAAKKKSVEREAQKQAEQDSAQAKEQPSSSNKGSAPVPEPIPAQVTPPKAPPVKGKPPPNKEANKRMSLNKGLPAIGQEYKPMRRWPIKQPFDEFYYYVQGLDENEIRDNLYTQRNPPEPKPPEAPQQEEIQASITTGSKQKVGQQPLDRPTPKGTKLQPNVSPLNQKVEGTPPVENPDEEEETKVRQSASNSTISNMDAYRVKVEVVKEKRKRPTRLNRDPSERATTKEEIRRLGLQGKTISGSNLLTERQENLVKNRGWFISDKDPWHISVRLARSEDPDLRNYIVQRRERIFKLINEGKAIRALNNARLLSMLRKVPEVADIETVSPVLPAFLSARSSEAPLVVVGQPEVVRPDTDSTGAKDDSKGDQSKLSTKRQSVSKVNKTPPPPPPPKGKPPKDVSEPPPSKPWEPEDTVVPFVDDKDVPEDISNDGLFQLLHVDQHFIIGKLKSAYSFDRYFDADIGSQAVQKMRGKYKHPLTDKFKSKKPPPPKKGKEKEKEKPKKAEKTNQVMPIEEEEPEPCESPPSPPLVIGKMKTFKFLEQKNYVPDPSIRNREFKFSREMSDDDMFDYILLSLKVFTVRKERASTYEPFSTQVSVTFTRRPLDESQMAETLKADSEYIIGGACNTLDL